MNSREEILEILETVDYLDMHIHPGDYSREELNRNILYLANSIDRESYNKIVLLSDELPNVIPMAGIHPSMAGSETFPPFLLEQLIKRSSLMGEIGLDFYWITDKQSFPFQVRDFEKQLALCRDNKVIPTIHTKGAEKEIPGYLKKYEIGKSLIHWYSGPEELIGAYLEAGCYFTIGPDIFTGSTVFEKVPLDRMFAETDNPTGMPWILGDEETGGADDIIRIYRELASKLEMTEKQLIALFKENLKNLLSA